MNLKFCRTIKSNEVMKPKLAAPKSTQKAKAINSARHLDDRDSSETDEYIELTVGQLIIGVFAFTFIVALTLMQCLVLVSGDLFEEPTKTIVQRVIEIMLFAIVLPFFALTCIAMIVMGCAGIVYTCKDLCENKSDIEQV